MKKILTFMMAIFFAVAVSAQTAVQTSKVLDNTYVGINAGVTTPLSFDAVFPVNPTVGLRIGKDLTPVFGLNVEGTAWFGSATDGQLRFDNNAGIHNAVRAVNTGLNGTINLNKLFGGYKGTPRKFEVSTIAGLGWLHVFNPSTVARDYNALTAKTGVDLAFNIGKDKAHQLYIEPAVLWNLNEYGYSNVKFDKRKAQLAIAVGYIYKFKTSNATHSFKTYDIGALTAEIDRLNAELAKKPTEVVKFVGTVKEAPVTTAAVCGVEIPAPVEVPFAFSDATLSDDGKALLSDIIGDAKAVPYTIAVEGYASQETDSKASADFNLKLSEARAEAVANYLKANSVNVSSVKGYGADATSQRVVKVIPITQ